MKSTAQCRWRGSARSRPVWRLRLGCDLVREAYVGSTGKAADRRDPLYNAALQHDDHRTRQKLEKGWQQGMMQGVPMTGAAREMAAALQAWTESQESIVGTSTSMRRRKHQRH